jgi:mono/diheme cytochrome c family protein
MKKEFVLILLAAVAVFASGRGLETGRPRDPGAAVGAAGDPQQAADKGIGPVKELKLEAVDPRLVGRGKQIFDASCASCHGLDKDIAGPALGGILKTETPEFVMNMILNTAEMAAKNETVRKGVAKFGMTMPSPGLSFDSARAVLEYLRTTGK